MRRTRLVLSRKPRQRVTVQSPDGEEFTITVQRIAGDQVSLLFESPETVRIWRTELGHFRRDSSAA